MILKIDIAKLTVAAGFNTEKTAANTWGTIKKKLGLVKAVATSSPKSSVKYLSHRSHPRLTSGAFKDTPKKQDTPAKKGITPTKKGVTPIKKGIARPVKRKHSHDDDEFPDGGASPIRRASNKKVKNDFVVEDDAED